MYDVNSSEPSPVSHPVVLIMDSWWLRCTVHVVSCVLIQVYVFEGMSKNVTCLGFYTSGQFMYSGGEDCMARIWDLR